MEFEPVGIEQVEPSSFRPVLNGWYRQKGGDDCPPRSRMQPFLVPSLAANAVLFGVNGEDYTYRLVGENIRQAIRRRLKGLTVRDVLGEGEYYEAVVEQLGYARRHRAPLYAVHRLLRPDNGLLVDAWRIVLPYRQGDAVTRLLTYQLYDMTAQTDRQEAPMRDLLPQTVFRVRPPD